MTAEIGVSGSIGGHRARGRLIGGFDPSSARLEAAAPFGAPAFIFVARGGDATLLLPRDGRVLEHGRPAEVLAAVAGVPLGAPELFHTMTGCELPEKLANPVAMGDNWRAVAGEGGAKAYFHRESASAPWRLVTVFVGGNALRWSWRADYEDFANGLPRTVRLVSAERNRFDLRLALAQVEINVPLSADAFRVVIPPDYQRITIDDLRRAGPLASDAE